MRTVLRWVIYCVPSGKLIPVLEDRPKLFYDSLVQASGVLIRKQQMYRQDTYYIQQVHIATIIDTSEIENTLLDQ